MWTKNAKQDTLDSIKAAEDKSESAIAEKNGMALSDFQEMMAAHLGFHSVDALLENRREEAFEGQALAANLIERASQSGALNSFQLRTSELQEKLSTASVIPASTSLTTLLHSIPSVFTYEQHFNATATLGNRQLPFPHVRFYRVTAHVLQLACLCIANNALEHGIEGHIKLKPYQEAIPTSFDHPIFVSLVNLLRLIDQPNRLSWSVQLFPSLPSDDSSSFGHSLFGGAMMAIWLHEFAHLLLGHLASQPNDVEEQELEADAFARRCLASVWDQSETQSPALTKKMPLLTGAYIFALTMSALRPSSDESQHNKVRAAALKRQIEDELGNLADVVSYMVTPLEALKDLAYEENASYEYQPLIIRLHEKGFLS